MEFWGVEVKNGESLKVAPGEDMILHVTQACLGIKQGKENEPVRLFVKFGDRKLGVKEENVESLEVTPGEDMILHLTQASQRKENESVFLFVKCGDQKLGIGILSPEKFPQISLNLVFEKEFELSHTWKHGRVFFTGYRERYLVDFTEEVTDSSDYEDDASPVNAANGEPEYKMKNVVLALEANRTRKMRGARKDDQVEDEEDSSESDESSEDSGKDEPPEDGGETGSSEDEDDSDEEDNEESEDEETPKKPEAGIKRPAESSKKTPVPEKKAKSVTPHKTDGKKWGYVRIATPYPSKQAGKAAPISAARVKQQTHKSTGEYSCRPCNRAFKTEDGLQSHTRAKHSA